MSAIGISFGGTSAGLVPSAVRVSGSVDPASSGTGTHGDASNKAVSAVAGGDLLAANSSLDAGGVPVDAARVAAIRKAIQTGSYPLNPARIGDAMIAAGLLLRIAT